MNIAEGVNNKLTRNLRFLGPISFCIATVLLTIKLIIAVCWAFTSCFESSSKEWEESVEISSETILEELIDFGFDAMALETNCALWICNLTI